jgi:hypothetical protein
MVLDALLVSEICLLIRELDRLRERRLQELPTEVLSEFRRALRDQISTIEGALQEQFHVHAEGTPEPSVTPFSDGSGSTASRISGLGRGSEPRASWSL